MSAPEQGYPEWRKTKPFRIDAQTLREAEQSIESCEGCMPHVAEIPFDYVLDQITGCDPEITDYVLPKPARCPRCGRPIRTGFWRWYISARGGRKVFILPGTLVSLKT